MVASGKSFGMFIFIARQYYFDKTMSKGFDLYKDHTPTELQELYPSVFGDDFPSSEKIENEINRGIQQCEDALNDYKTALDDFQKIKSNLTFEKYIEFVSSKYPTIINKSSDAMNSVYTSLAWLANLTAISRDDAFDGRNAKQNKEIHDELMRICGKNTSLVIDYGLSYLATLMVVTWNIERFGEDDSSHIFPDKFTMNLVANMLFDAMEIDEIFETLDHINGYLVAKQTKFPGKVIEDVKKHMAENKEEIDYGYQ